MDTYSIQIGDGVLEVPWWWLDALLAWLGLVGLVLLLLGRRLVRFSIGAIGIVLGASAALTICITSITPRWPDVPPPAIAILGGIFGGIAGALLWRVGIGTLLAIAVAVIAPIVCLIVLELPGPKYEPVTDEFYTMANHSLGIASGENGQAEPIEPQDILIPAEKASDDLAAASRVWWEERTNDEKWIFALATSGGAVLAILIGLAMPYFSAALVTSLIGSLCLLGIVYRVAHHAGESTASILPASAIGFFYFLVGVTLVGVILQWTIFRPPRKTDAQE